MSMFKNHQDEETICQILKAFVEEWGPELVYVTLPNAWQENAKDPSLGRVRIKFMKDNSVGVHVLCDEINVAIHYEVQLAQW